MIHISKNLLPYIPKYEYNPYEYEEEQKKYRIKYNIKNKELLNIYARERRKKNPEKVKIISQRYYLKNREKILIRSKLAYMNRKLKGGEPYEM